MQRALLMPKKIILKKDKDFSHLKKKSEPKTPKFLLLKEYEIIQKKIDNYGSSDIAYKTLTITLTAAALFASEKPIFGNECLLFATFIITIILFEEGKNHIYEKRLADRARTIEKAIPKGARGKPFPGIVTCVAKKEKLSFKEIIDHVRKNSSQFIIYYLIIITLLYYYFKN